MRHRIAALLVATLVSCTAQANAQPAAAANSVVVDEAAFFAAVRENLVRAQRAAHQFSYKERRTRLHTNPFGKLGTGGVDLFHVYPSVHPKLTYRRILVRDGHPLTQAELARQDREFQARAAGLARRMEHETAADRRHRLAEEAQARRRAEELIEDIMSAIAFSVTGRGVHNNQPAISVSFKGRPEARPRTSQGRVAQKFAGNVWIHAERLEVMHVTATATDTVSFGFGLIARLNEGTTGSLTRQPVRPGIWMPTSVRITGHGRALLQLRSLKIDYAIDWFEYQAHDGSRPGLD
jgi:hypothetical protein